MPCGQRLLLVGGRVAGRAQRTWQLFRQPYLPALGRPAVALCELLINCPTAGKLLPTPTPASPTPTPKTVWCAMRWMLSWA